MTGIDRLIQRLAQSPVIATIVVTALTIVLIGGVLLTMTSAGCGPAKALGLKGIAQRCATDVTAARPSPSISPSPIESPVVSFIPQPPPTQPVAPPASAPMPPNTDPSSPGGLPAYPTVADASGSGGPPPSVANCRLPVYVGPSGSGGFIVFPGNTFIGDPASGVTIPSPSPGGPTPSPAPGYGPGPYGQYGLSYDRIYSRWLPVSAQAVSADGTRYAFAPADGIYVVTVSNGAMTEVGKGHAWIVLSVGTSGVYATNPNLAGLWLLPYSGAPRQIVTTGYWQAVGGGAAYGTATSAVPQGATVTIQQLNLSTGAIADYFTRPGVQAQVAGFDGQGMPVIYANGAGVSEIWVGHLFLMENPTGPYTYTGFTPNGPPVADAHGLWFSGYYNSGYNSGGTAIVVYIPGSGVYGVSGIGAQLAGGCY